MADIELRQGEVLLEEVKGDYWEKFLVIFSTQIRGKYWMTNQRIIFHGNYDTNLDLEIKDIQSLKPCLIGGLIPFIPTGINVSMKDGKSYKLSLLARDKYIRMIQDAMRR